MKGKHYLYGMRLRGFSIGCQPMEGLVRAMEDSNYHNVLIYDRLLSSEEVEEYELEFIKEGSR